MITLSQLAFWGTVGLDALATRRRSGAGVGLVPGRRDGQAHARRRGPPALLRPGNGRRRRPVRRRADLPLAGRTRRDPTRARLRRGWTPASGTPGAGAGCRDVGPRRRGVRSSRSATWRSRCTRTRGSSIVGRVRRHAALPARRRRRAADALPSDGILADGLVPPFVVPAFATSYNTVGRLLPLFEHPVQVDGPERGGGIFVLTADGHGAEADFIGRAGGAAPHEHRLGNLRSDGTVVVAEDAVCIGSTPAGPNATFTLAVPAGVVLPDPYVHMTYSTELQLHDRRARRCRVRNAGGRDDRSHGRRGRHRVDRLAPEPGRRGDRLPALRRAARTHRLCIERIEIGGLAIRP